MDASEYKKRLKCKFHVLLHKTGNIANKEAMLSGFGVESSSDLTVEQLTGLINSLEGKPNINHSAAKELLKEKRSSILKLITGSPTALNPKERGLGIPNDWARINPFILNHAGAYLFELNLEQLVWFQRKLFSMRETGWYQGKKSHDAAPSAPTTQQPPQKLAPTPTQITMVFSATTALDELPN